MENIESKSVSVWMMDSLTRWLVFAPSCLVWCLVGLSNHRLGNVADGKSHLRLSGIWHLGIGDLGKGPH